MRSVAAQPASSTSGRCCCALPMTSCSSSTSRLAARLLRLRSSTGLKATATAQSASISSISTTATRIPFLAPASSPLRFERFNALRRPLVAASAAAASSSSSDAASASATATTTTAAQDTPSPSSSSASSSSSSSSSSTSTSPPRPSKAYPFPSIEAKWQRLWERHETFRTPDIGFAPSSSSGSASEKSQRPALDTSRPKSYVLDMFPYPSGAGLHVGHPEGYTATDIVARVRRMKGHNVLHPIGWDAFGLPAEQYAIQTGTHPAVTTQKNVDRFRQQLKALGFSYDWSREVSTTDPQYYKWTQWIFLQLFNRGLAYQATVPVNWCPALGTVLANEEVVGGVSERGGHPVVRLPMKQWMLRITAYADRLLEGLDGLEWDENIKDMQRNWIGRSEGCDIVFGLVGGEGSEFAAEEEEAAASLSASSSSSSSSSTCTLTAFTTRADTLFGVTYVVLAPEHPLALKLATPAQRAAVQAYITSAASKSDLERTAEKTGAAARSGVATGSFAVHPVTGAEVPVWVADYVLGSYGTGAVMAVPAHDSRDAEFARQHSLPVVEVVVAAEGEGDEKSSSPSTSTPTPIFTSDGVCVSSSGNGLDLNGLTSAEARAKVGAFLSSKNDGGGLGGGPRISYKLRDWLFARQRYWGEPFPIAYSAEDEAQDTPLAIDEADLPLVLPPTDDFSPNGTPDPPLAALKEWVNFTDPKTGKQLVRETSTMPQWAGSCWYYIRYLQPWNDAALVDRAAADYWLPVDLYVGGAEHAVLHLLYARFWHKVLFDLGVVPTDEPFRRLVSQGMILGEVEYTARQDAGGNWCNEDEDGENSSSTSSVVRIDPSDAVKSSTSPTGLALASAPEVHVSARAHKMSKSRGNVVNPDDVVAEFGADSLRLYEMFMGPLRETKVWSTRSVDGVHRFLARSWRLTCQQESSEEVLPTKDQLRLLHSTIRRVTDETDALRFNTAISAMMEFVNGATKWDQPRPRSALRTFALLLAPYAPHLAEEAWEHLDGESFAELAPKESYENGGVDAGAGASSSNSSSSSSSSPSYSTLTFAPWPVADESLLVAETVTLPVQVNGKMRGSVELPAEGDGAGEAAATAAARGIPAVARLLEEEGAKVARVVFVPGRIINFIVVGGGGGGGGGRGKKKKKS